MHDEIVMVRNIIVVITIIIIIIFIVLHTKKYIIGIKNSYFIEKITMSYEIFNANCIIFWYMKL